MEIRKGTVVICDYLLPRCAVGIVQKVLVKNRQFMVKIVWPENTGLITLIRRAVTPICNEPDDLRKIVKLLKPGDLPF